MVNKDCLLTAAAGAAMVTSDPKDTMLTTRARRGALNCIDEDAV